jgi:proteasome assembly chaperone (PAC2) family protein
MDVQAAGNPGQIGIDLQNDLGAGFNALLLPHLAQAHLKATVFVHGRYRRNKGIAGIVLVNKSGIVTDIADNMAGVAMLHALDKCLAVQGRTGVNMAVHTRRGNKFIVAGTGLDAFHILHPGGYGVKLTHERHRLVAAASETDSVSGLDQVQTALKGGAFLIQ